MSKQKLDNDTFALYEMLKGKEVVHRNEFPKPKSAHKCHFAIGRRGAFIYLQAK